LQDYFYEYIAPRRIRNHDEENVYFQNNNKRKIIHRVVLPNDIDRGQLFPILTSSLSALGIGIGIYFFQILALAFIFFVLTIIMIPVME
jgi:hypothetical protein